MILTFWGHPSKHPTFVGFLGRLNVMQSRCVYFVKDLFCTFPCTRYDVNIYIVQSIYLCFVCFISLLICLCSSYCISACLDATSTIQIVLDVCVYLFTEVVKERQQPPKDFSDPVWAICWTFAKPSTKKITWENQSVHVQDLFGWVLLRCHDRTRFPPGR